MRYLRYRQGHTSDAGLLVTMQAGVPSRRVSSPFRLCEKVRSSRRGVGDALVPCELLFAVKGQHIPDVDAAGRYRRSENSTDPSQILDKYQIQSCRAIQNTRVENAYGGCGRAVRVH